MLRNTEVNIIFVAARRGWPNAYPITIYITINRQKLYFAEIYF